MTEDNSHILSLFGKESDPEIVAQGERDFHTALYHIQSMIDPAYSFILYRFNRVGVEHESLDSVLFIDDDDQPCFGVNFSQYHELTPLARIGVVEHNVGHLMSGHLGDRLGHQLREYCELKYGPTAGRALYYMTIETAADSFVSFPGALQDSDRPFYDICKLGLERYAPTIEILRKIEEKCPPSDDEDDMLEQLQQLAKEMTEDAPENWDDLDGAEGMGMDDEEESENKGEANSEGGAEGEGGGAGGDGEAESTEKDPIDVETGGVPTKDIVATGSKADAMVGEDKIRSIIKEAMENTTPIRSRGFMGGDVGQFIESAEAQPIVPWYQRMNSAISAKLSEERRVSKLRLNRRLSYFKGRTYENTTSVTFCIDTSGSMGSAELSHVESEVDAIAQHTDEVNVIHCDCNVAKMEKYRRGMALENFFGRGGTSFTPALEYIYENFESEDYPSIVVYFTDGYGERLDEDSPAVAAFADCLIWILTPDGMDEEDFIKSKCGDIGEVIKVEEW